MLKKIKALTTTSSFADVSETREEERETTSQGCSEVDLLHGKHPANEQSRRSRLQMTQKESLKL